MAYKVAQILSSSDDIIGSTSITNNLTSISVQVGYDNNVPSGISTGTGDEGLTFTDSYLYLANNSYFSPETVYYLTATLTCNRTLSSEDASILASRGVTLKLKDDISQTSSDQQYVDSFTLNNITTLEDNSDVTFSYHLQIIFKPIKNFARLYFLLNRTIADLVAIYNDSGSITDDFINIDDIFLYSIANRNDIKTNLSNIIKIGVQGTPGLLMCINGEAIRIGPSGMYQIKNGYKINFIQFLPKPSQYFIFDYLYDASSSSTTT